MSFYFQITTSIALKLSIISFVVISQAMQIQEASLNLIKVLALMQRLTRIWVLLKAMICSNLLTMSLISLKKNICQIY